MEQTTHGRYLKGLAIFTIALLITTAGFNWFVDPFGIYSSPSIDGFNSLKPEVSNHIRIAQAYAITRTEPKAICLGTSRAEVGIDPDHEGWSYAPVHNSALPMARIYEIARYLQHANNTKTLRQVVLFLDFLSFDLHAKCEGDFNELLLSVSYDGQANGLLAESVNYVSLLFSLDVLLHSIATVRNQTGSGVSYKENGVLSYENSAIEEGHHALFLYRERGFKRYLYIPERFRFSDTQTGNTSFGYYRDILRISYQNDIDLRISTSPSHVRQWEVLAACGLWPQFEEWKRRLVEINEEEAYLAGKPPFPLWDFSIYNKYTMEPVPPLGDTETEMQWHWESSHYKKELGDLVLDCIFGYQRSWEGTLGVLLNSRNIDEHILDTRADRQDYRDTHPDDIAEIENRD